MQRLVTQKAWMASHILDILIAFHACPSATYSLLCHKGCGPRKTTQFKPPHIRLQPMQVSGETVTKQVKRKPTCLPWFFFFFFFSGFSSEHGRRNPSKPQRLGLLQGSACRIVVCWLKLALSLHRRAERTPSFNILESAQDSRH